RYCVEWSGIRVRDRCSSNVSCACILCSWVISNKLFEKRRVLTVISRPKGLPREECHCLASLKKKTGIPPKGPWPMATYVHGMTRFKQVLKYNHKGGSLDFMPVVAIPVVIKRCKKAKTSVMGRRVSTVIAST